MLLIKRVARQPEFASLGKPDDIAARFRLAVPSRNALFLAAYMSK
jgi:hypothetical protein